MTLEGFVLRDTFLHEKGAEHRFHSLFKKISGMTIVSSGMSLYQPGRSKEKMIDELRDGW